MTEDDTHDRVASRNDKAIDSADIRGYDFDGASNLDEFLDAYTTTDFQVAQLAGAVDIAKEMQEVDTTVYLTFTSNIVSSGLHEAITYLVREGFVDMLITTSGSLIKDAIKTAKPFKVGSWDTDESELHERGVNHLNNVHVPSNRYVWLGQYFYDFFGDFFAEEEVRTPAALARELGATLDDEHSVLRQAADNDVPIYCPTLADTEVNNFLYYYRQGYGKEVDIEILDDYDSLIQDGLLADETDLIAVNGGAPKHHVIMTNLFRGDVGYVVYISTGMEGDGSLSGAPSNGAVSWGKVKDHDTSYTQVEAETTLVFSPLIAGVLKD